MSGVTDNPENDLDDIAVLPEGAACAKCVFSRSVPIIDPATGQPMLDGSTQRICKRFPPVAVMVPVQTVRGTGLQLTGVDVPVAEDGFCYEFTERDAPDEPEVTPISLV